MPVSHLRGNEKGQGAKQMIKEEIKNQIAEEIKNQIAFLIEAKQKENLSALDITIIDLAINDLINLIKDLEESK